jgi:hypothetical protein
MAIAPASTSITRVNDVRRHRLAGDGFLRAQVRHRQIRVKRPYRLLDLIKEFSGAGSQAAHRKDQEPAHKGLLREDRPP